MRSPTRYSPDRQWIYLSSLDVDCGLDDLEALKQNLEGVLRAYTTYLSRKEYSKLHKLRADCIEICRLVFEENPERYGDPDALLENGFL